MPTYALHIAGQVQGIGFRPFVYRLATQLQLSGWVSNQTDGVRIKVQGDEASVQDFYRKLTTQSPPLAVIDAARIERIAEEVFKGFQIKKETGGPVANLILTPDLALCPACRQELQDSTNRRYRYAFTTCTSCGPRYSIMAKIPYDREHTAMAPFVMCPACAQEYHDPENRRYYSQTNSCPHCPISLVLYDARQQFISADQQQCITSTVKLLRGGKIVAVKGIGGYLLLADATNAQVIQTLRERKHRPAKPFALMYPDLEMALQDVVLQEEEQALLLSPASPVVLAKKKVHPATGIQAELLAPKLNKLGIMLPYTPLFELLLSELARPVVATSANRQGIHIVFEDPDAFAQLQGITDFVLLHNRAILFPQDDSVVQFSPQHRQQIVLRRSRGYAPTVHGALKNTEGLLALGADLKNTFAFTASGNTYASQYLGDLATYENELNMTRSLQHLTRLVGFQPSLVVTDLHPGYTSGRLGKELAQRHGVPQVQVQHHEAHFAAVLAENNLLEREEPVLGVIWDGTGFGGDNLIRGGEFLLFSANQIAPLAQLAPYPHLLGDKMAKEPRLAALALCHDLAGAAKVLSPYFTSMEWELYRGMLQHRKYNVQTTSMGRLFDAAAALVGLASRNSYEGEGAMLLEAAAARDPEVYQVPGYAIEDFSGKTIVIKSILRQMLADVRQGQPPERVAARFHVTLVDMIATVAAYYGLQHLAFSGGVFQNSLLIDLLLEKLSNRFQLYIHRQLPPNDACISVGQLTWMQLTKTANVFPSKEAHAVPHPLNS